MLADLVEQHDLARRRPPRAISPRLAWMTASQSPCCCLDGDDRVQRVAVAGIDLQRLLEHVERLAPLAQVLPNHAQPVVDADHVGLGLAVAVLDQDGLVDLPGALPVLHLEQQVGPADQRRQVGRVEVVGGLVELQRLLVVAELVGGLGGPVVELVELARSRARAGATLRTSMSRTGDKRRPLLGLEVQVGQRLGRLDVLGVERHAPRRSSSLGLVRLAEPVEVDAARPRAGAEPCRATFGV